MEGLGVARERVELREGLDEGERFEGLIGKGFIWLRPERG